MVDIASACCHTLAAREKLIVALDVPSVKEAQGIVDDLKDSVSFYKIGLHLQLDPELPSLFVRLLQDQKRIFLDFKFIDIPATVEGAVKAAVRLHIKFITVMAQRHIVEAAVKGKGSSDLKILAVTLLTGMTEENMRAEYNTNLSLEDFITKRAGSASQAGCDGVISSPNKIELIRSAINREKFLIVTGIRQIGAEPNDQKRTATPYDAIMNGADYLVVGRPIIRQEDKRRAAQDIVDEMAAALNRREELGRLAPLPVLAEIY